MPSGYFGVQKWQAEKREGYATLSYIVIHQGASPSFGKAQYFLQHSLGHNQHFLAAVDWFGNPQLDTNSRLRFVPSSEAPKRSLIEIANLFRPLATAIDDGKVVFKLFQVIVLLNYKLDFHLLCTQPELTWFL